MIGQCQPGTAALRQALEYITRRANQYGTDDSSALDIVYEIDRIARAALSGGEAVAAREPVAWRYKCRDGSEVLMLKRLTDEQKRRGYYTGEDGEDEVDGDEAVIGPFHWAEETPLFAALPSEAIGREDSWHGDFQERARALSSNSGAPTASRGVGATNATQPVGSPNIRDEIIEQCAKIADLWVTDCGHVPTKYLNARDYAVCAVKDVADALRALAVTRPTSGGAA